MDIDIEHVARLARITLSKEEADRLSAELPDILQFIDQITSADVPEVDPKDQFLLVKNRLREDRDPYKSGTFKEKILNEALKTRDDRIEVKQILSYGDE